MPDEQRTSAPSFRWVVVFAAALLLAIAMGTLVNGLSAFVIPLEMHFGWDRAEVSTINAVGLIGIALGGIAMGFLADRVSTRAICMLGAAVLSASLLLAAWATELWQFYTLFFTAGAIGGGALFAPVFALVAGWFVTGRGLAIGIAAAGQGLGQGLVPFVSGHLIEALGWQAAFSSLGAFAALSLVPLSLLMIRAPQQVGTAPSAADGAGSLPPRVLLPALSLAVLGCCTGMAVPLMHLVPLIQGVCGVGAEAGGPLLAMLVAAVAGRVFFGRLADMLGPLRAWMVATAWQTLLMLGFVTLGSMQSFWLFAPLYGFGYGGVMVGVLVTVGTLTPAARRASATGIVLAFGWAGHALGSWQGGFFFDLTDGYFWTYSNAVIAGLINLVIVATLWRALRRNVASAA